MTSWAIDLPLRAPVRVAFFAALAVALGLAAGLGASFLGSRLVESLLWGISPTDPLALASAGLFLFLVALLASALPALRASRTAPSTSLRDE